MKRTLLLFVGLMVLVLLLTPQQIHPSNNDYPEKGLIDEFTTLTIDAEYEPTSKNQYPSMITLDSALIFQSIVILYISFSFRNIRRKFLRRFLLASFYQSSYVGIPR
ncbi:hypothetical protein [Radiobacillus sp. PE A8.2]|uniref:hypothetical protein n=1 Tax=Radiobacillus sp. PE A8.2 TaxID=3380349 RepID=UPI00389065ED